MQWSSCSQQALKHCFEVGLGNCLYNIPKIIHGGPICGNNIVEHGEQCDCGFSKHCERFTRMINAIMVSSVTQLLE